MIIWLEKDFFEILIENFWNLRNWMNEEVIKNILKNKKIFYNKILDIIDEMSKNWLIYFLSNWIRLTY